jgi:ABC-type transport system involved in multi-copper enzyme maturation permease subunit
MIWLVWRRHWLGMLTLILFMLCLAIYLIIGNQPARAAYYQVTNGQSPALCYASQSTSALCHQLTMTWFDTYNDPGDLTGWLGIMIAPLLIGMFLGAPLVAGEIERGTQRLAWTQGVSRQRWLLTLIGSEAGVALLLSAGIQLAVWWWISYQLQGNYFNAFDMLGVAPLAYVAFALALGMALGALTRRVVPAMLLTLVGYLAVRLLIAIFARPSYLPPLTLTWDPYVTRMPTGQPGGADWVISSGWIGAGGYPVNQSEFFGSSGPPACAGRTTFPGPMWNGWNTYCTHISGWQYQDVWQPASRFWVFQGIESAIFLALSAALIALTVWLVRRVIA